MPTNPLLDLGRPEILQARSCLERSRQHRIGLVSMRCKEAELGRNASSGTRAHRRIDIALEFVKRLRTIDDAAPEPRRDAGCELVAGDGTTMTTVAPIAHVPSALMLD
jgi:hypothetical protein